MSEKCQDIVFEFKMIQPLFMSYMVDRYELPMGNKDLSSINKLDYHNACVEIYDIMDCLQMNLVPVEILICNLLCHLEA